MTAVIDSDEQELLTLDEAAEHTGLSRECLRLLAALDVGPDWHYVGGTVVYRTALVNEWHGRQGLRDDLKAALSKVVDTLLDVATSFDQIP